jgi:hypothetical protein
MLIGSGTVVKTALVIRLTLVPAANESVMCWEIEYGAASEAIPVVTVPAVAIGAVKGWAAFDSEIPAAQNAVVGGAKPLVVSTQLVKLAVPDPVVDVVDRLLANVMFGGVTGFVKS